MRAVVPYVSRTCGRERLHVSAATSRSLPDKPSAPVSGAGDGRHPPAGLEPLRTQYVAQMGRRRRFSGVHRAETCSTGRYEAVSG